jgi:hypothetical protein
VREKLFWFAPWESAPEFKQEVGFFTADLALKGYTWNITWKGSKDGSSEWAIVSYKWVRP